MKSSRPKGPRRARSGARPSKAGERTSSGSQKPASGVGGGAGETGPVGAAKRTGARAANVASTGVTVGRAAAGDVTAITSLAVTGAMRVWRSKIVRRTAVVLLFMAMLLPLAMCGHSLGDGGASAAEAPHGIPGAAWAAYRSAAQMRCHSSGAVATDGIPRPGWHTPDMALVMTLGAFESSHGRAVRVRPGQGFTPGIDAFGQHSGPIRSVPLYDPADFHPGVEDDPLVSTIFDTDGGRWDGNPWIDHAVGATQLLPSFVATHGRDGNGDGVIDPHNIFDSVATTAGYFCSGLAAGRTRDELLHGYTNDADYDALVLEAYPAMVVFAEDLPPVVMPSGGPLGWDPTAQRRWGTVLGLGLLDDPLLAALLDAVADERVAGGGIGLDPADVDCAGDVCLWAAPAGIEDESAWRQLAQMGLAGPVQMPLTGEVWVAGAMPATGWTLTWPVASPHSRPTLQLPAPGWPPPQEAVALPLPISPWPATPGGAPAWIDWHLPVDSPLWAARSSQGRWTTSVAEGVGVYAPAAGTVSAASGCAQVTDRHGWRWGLCSIDLVPAAAYAAGNGDKVHAGQRLGVTAGATVEVTLRGPGGDPACPEELLGRWVSEAAVPDSAFEVRSGAHLVATAWELIERSVQPDVPTAEASQLRRSAFAVAAALFEKCQGPGYASTLREQMSEYLAANPPSQPQGVI